MDFHKALELLGSNPKCFSNRAKTEWIREASGYVGNFYYFYFFNRASERVSNLQQKGWGTVERPGQKIHGPEKMKQKWDRYLFFKVMSPSL